MISPQESKQLLFSLNKTMRDNVARNAGPLTPRDEKVIRLGAEAVWASIVATLINGELENAGG